MKNISGIIFTLLIGLMAKYMSEALAPYFTLEALTIAIIIGILYANTIGVDQRLSPGIKFTLKKILKWGIVLLGFKLNIEALMALGPSVLLLVLLYVPFTLFLAVLIGKRFGLPPKISALLGVGTSICGASAIVAMTPIIDAHDDDAVIAVSVVSLLGALGVLLYAGLAPLLSEITFGVWSGLSLHGVAHAIAAAFTKSTTSGEIGTFVKMARVLMIVPTSLILSYLFRDQEESKGSKKIQFPYYVGLFLLAGLVNTLNILPSNLVKLLGQGSSYFILMAMTAMGLSVTFSQLKKSGVIALLTGTLLWVLVSLISLGAIHFIV